jgi:hypothetical protein
VSPTLTLATVPCVTTTTVSSIRSSIYRHIITSSPQIGRSSAIGMSNATTAVSIGSAPLPSGEAAPMLEQTEFACHSVGKALPSSTLSSHGFSSDDYHPCPNTAAPDKTPCHPFIIPSRVHVPGQDSRDTVLASGNVLPPLHPHSQASVSTAAATMAPPSFSHVEDLRAGLAHFPSPSRYQVPPTSYTATWDTRCSASTLPLGYEATGDDQSLTRMPVLTPTPTPSTANNDP